MKKTSYAVAVLAALLISATAGSAQSAKAVSIGISGGATIPVGDFGDAFTTGYNGTASLMFKSFGSPIGLRVDGMYNNLSFKDDNSIDAVILGANANLVYSLPGVGISPYLIGGAGVYNMKLDFNDGADSESETKLGVNGGVGASIPLSGFNAFIEARYHHVFTDGAATQFVPVTVGISF